MTHASRKTALLIVFSVVFIDLLGFGIVLPLMPIYARQLAEEYSKAQTALIIGLLLVSYSVMQLVFATVWGRISDRIGRRPVLLISLAGSTVFYGLFGASTAWGSLSWMFFSRIGGGIAGATIPTAQAFIADVTEREHRTRGMAVIGVAFGLGFTFGPLLGALALLAAQEGPISPWPGYTASLLSAVAFTCAVVKLPESLDRKVASASRERLSFGLFYQAVSVPSISLLLAVLFLCNYAFAKFEATLSLSITGFLEWERAGWQIMLVFAYIGLVQSVVQGGLVRWLAGKISEGVLCLTGAALAMVGYVLLALATHPVTGSAVRVMLAASVVIAGLSFVYPSIQSLISRRSDPAKQGVILGFSSTINSLGRIVGMLLGVLLHYQTQTLPFWVAAVLMFVVLVLATVATGRGEDWNATVAEG